MDDVAAGLTAAHLVHSELLSRLAAADVSLSSHYLPSSAMSCDERSCASVAIGM